MKINFYNVELILNTQGVSLETLENSLWNLGQDLQISQQTDNGKNIEAFKIHICTEQPHLVFDTCSLFGKLSHIKIDEMKKEV